LRAKQEHPQWGGREGTPQNSVSKIENFIPAE